MKLLVLGGAGFIGSNFVRRTVEKHSDVSVTVFDLLTYAGQMSNLQGLESNIQFINGDICDREKLDENVKNADFVINFAAETHNDNSLKNSEPFIRTNILGTHSVVQACSKFGVRYHHVSTDEVYGDLPIESKEKFNRDSSYNPSSPYSASKASSDHLVRSWIRSFGLNATISNCSNNYGPNQHKEKLIPRTISLVSAGKKPKIFGQGLNVRDWIHVDDHNDGIWEIIKKGTVGQTYLLGSNSERTNLQVVQTILTILGKPRDFIEFIADRPGHDLRYAIDASATIEELGWTPKHIDFEKSLEVLVPQYL